MACAPCKQKRKLEIVEQRLGGKTYTLTENGEISEKKSDTKTKILSILMRILLGIILLPILILISVVFILYYIISSILGKETVLDIHKILGKFANNNNNNEIVEFNE